MRAINYAGMIVAAGLAVATPSVAFAQSGANSSDGTYTTTETRDDNDFPWGLLGLLGLAGLLGRKRHDDTRVHVNRTDGPTNNPR